MAEALAFPRVLCRTSEAGRPASQQGARVVCRAALACPHLAILGPEHEMAAELFTFAENLPLLPLLAPSRGRRWLEKCVCRVWEASEASQERRQQWCH